MQYFIAFLEGTITFISPCLLPMLPLYAAYFAGGGERTAKKSLINSLGFVLGFTVVFVILGALAGTLGGLLNQYRTAVNIISGLIVIVFGLSYTGLFSLSIFKGISASFKDRQPGFLSSLVFGIIFSIGWTPCVGAFLGSALLLASQQGHVLSGIVMLLLYSLGLGIPFILAALLIDKLKNAFNFIKKHYRIINLVCGILLILTGILMITGLINVILTV